MHTENTDIYYVILYFCILVQITFESYKLGNIVAANLKYFLSFLGLFLNSIIAQKVCVYEAEYPRHYFIRVGWFVFFCHCIWPLFCCNVTRVVYTGLYYVVS